eukprot:TRINITY_DN105510_c0_g1_i1.p1 TRINITY_DN105510_c0_g1~~TRINITY_DN105510_c0_g1_i1.p1  ORF type:complete len:379 (+),score=81.12 TRINITY_DN105510_c0_g1_i1:40-1176(+)
MPYARNSWSCIDEDPHSLRDCLEQYGYAARGPHVWQALPGSAEPPKLLLELDGHREVDKHTCYKVRCSLEGMKRHMHWSVDRRLVELREGLRDPLVSGLSGLYKELFSDAPFALAGGPPGTSKRLTKWLARLADCVNNRKVSPAFVVQVLRFLEAPSDDQAELKEISDDSGDDSFGKHHMKIHAIHMEELSKRFEFEAAERCCELRSQGSCDAGLLKEVLRCLVENLEDYNTRLEARGCAWDRHEQRVIQLDSASKQFQQAAVVDALEPALHRALKAASAAASETDFCDASPLARRKTMLRTECRELLELKTRATEELDEAVLAAEESDLSTADTATPQRSKSQSASSFRRLMRSVSTPRLTKRSVSWHALRLTQGSR